MDDFTDILSRSYAPSTPSSSSLSTPYASLLYALPFLGTAAAGLLTFRLLRRTTPAPNPRASLDALGRPLRVIITGSSRGFGLSLAKRFLAEHELTRVAICSRNAEAILAARGILEASLPGTAAGRVFAAPCDVGDPQSVDKFVAAATSFLGGGVDIFIANAAQVFNPRSNLVDLEDAAAGAVADVVGTNLTGSVLCARAALRVMRAQEHGGVVWFVSGDGARGNATPGNVCYGATKTALVHLTKSLAVELQGTRMAAHIFDPGMMGDTDLLATALTGPRSKDPKELKRKVDFLNVLSQTSEQSAAFLYPHLVAAFPKSHEDDKRRGLFRYPKALDAMGVIGRLLYSRINPGYYKDRFFKIVDGKAEVVE